MLDFDIIVIGGGAMGLASAYYASLEKKRVLILERHTFFNEQGSSGGLSRMFRVIHSQEYLARLALASKPLWEELERLGGRDLLDVCGTVWFGEKNVSTTEGEIEAAINVMKTLGLSVKLLTSSEIETEYNFSHLPGNYIGVYQEDAATIRVPDVLRTLSTLAEAQGVTSRQRAEVHDLIPEADGVTIKVTEHDVDGLKPREVIYRTEKVILCPGPYANETIRPLGFQLDLTIWQLASAYFPIKSGEDGPPMWFAFQNASGDDPGIYYGFPESNWERPGFARVAPAFASRMFRSVKYRAGAPDTSDLRRTSSFVLRCMPGLDPTPVDLSSCLITMTRDQDPVLDFVPDFVPNHERIVLYVGGWGFKFVPIVGKALAEMAIQGETTCDVSHFRIGRKDILSQESQYRAIIKSGLPTTKQEKSVLIAGAGMAGLVAGSLLKDAGHHVTILEASDRVGGRIRTLREPFDKIGGKQLYGEAGAMRIPSFHVLINDYIRKYKLPTSPFLETDIENNGYLLANGVRTRRKEYLRNPDLLGYPVAANEVGRTAEAMLDAIIQSIVEFVESDPNTNWPIILERYDKYSIRTYLKDQTRLSEAAIEMIGILLDEEALMSTSFIESIRDQIDINANNTYTEIQGGMDRLPRAFLQQLKREVNLKSRILRIEQDGGGVVFRTEKRKYKGDRAIITVPFSALRLVDIDPPLSQNKLKAIRQLHYDSATKILLQFRSRFWEREDGIKGGGSISDLPVRFVYYPSHGIGAEGPAVLLASYTWSDESLRWDALPESKRLEFALADLAKLHGDVVYSEYMKGTSYSWSSDEFTRGAFALFQPGQQTMLLPFIAAPEGRIHFAGEHTTLKHAWIEGAIESGIRAAVEVAALFDTEISLTPFQFDASIPAALTLTHRAMQQTALALQNIAVPSTDNELPVSLPLPDHVLQDAMYAAAASRRSRSDFQRLRL
jgi:monoamine oxidase